MLNPDALLAEILATPQVVCRYSLMNLCLERKPPRRVVEFGVFMGHMLHHMARMAEWGWGCDTFTGLPSEWTFGTTTHKVGTFACNIEDVKEIVGGNVTLVQGLFAETIPLLPTEHMDLVHIDCDLYASTKDILEAYVPKLAPGTIVVFDELIDQRGRYPQWREGEWRALVESGLRLRPIARSSWEQVAFEKED